MKKEEPVAERNQPSAWGVLFSMIFSEGGISTLIILPIVIFYYLRLAL